MRFGLRSWLLFNTHESAGASVLRETDKALLVLFADGTEKWIPKSVIHETSEVFAADTEGTLVVKSWFAEKEGLP
jgi:hypothetical protein